MARKWGKLWCPFCRKHVEFVLFSLWPGVVIKICPKCRIGLGVLTVAKIKAAEKKLIKVRKLGGR